MRMFVNPYNGKLLDLDRVPVSPGEAKFCPDTGQPLNAKAVELFSYPGPASDRAAWAADALKTVSSIEAQANEPNNLTLKLTGATVTVEQPASTQV